MKEFLFFKTGKKFSKIILADILYIQAEKRHIMIVTVGNCLYSFVSIGQVEKMLPSSFCRIHRSYIISLRHTDAFDNELAYLGNRKIPIAEQYKNVLKNNVAAIHAKTGAFSLDNGEVDRLLNDLNS